ncbi:MAG: 2-dehydropantoate 2-reductase [marine bacterium B5-7]|nr:MAG: 2-dehydropantoate 2-reductase [marine bacterium B5-7]
MKICIFGAGAIGGYFAVSLARSGQDISVVARGPHLQAIQQHGLKLKIEGEERVAHVMATDDPTELGPQDYVIVTLKAHSAVSTVDSLLPLLGPHTAVVTAMNGIPWWYFHGLDCPWQDQMLESVDPGGRQWRMIGPERAIGCVVYPATEVIEPGVVEHISGNRMVVGEPDQSDSPRLKALRTVLIDAGFKSPVRRIRDEIWVKLWGNLCFNPISALTRATLDTIVADPNTREVARRMMTEAQVIGEKLGVRFGVDIDKRIDGAGAVGTHKTSMLQDLERGRPMEIDALVTSVQELGSITGTPTPTIDTILALIKLLEKSVR